MRGELTLHARCPLRVVTFVGFVDEHDLDVERGKVVDGCIPWGCSKRAAPRPSYAPPAAVGGPAFLSCACGDCKGEFAAVSVVTNARRWGCQPNLDGLFDSTSVTPFQYPRVGHPSGQASNEQPERNCPGTEYSGWHGHSEASSRGRALS